MNKYFYALSLCLSGFTVALAQSPGGIGGASLKLWIKADAGTSTTTTGPLANWTYANDPTKSFTATAQPTFTTSLINFKPAVTFNGTQYMAGPNAANAPIPAGDDEYAYFGVWMSNNAPAGQFQRVWSQRGNAVSNNGTGIWVWNGNNTYGNQAEITPFTHLAQMPFTVNTWYITNINLLTEGANDQQLFDQTNLASGTPDTRTSGAARSIATDLNVLGNRVQGAPDEPFQGSIAELIVYDRPITDATERNRIFSYLGLKYGITIGTNMLPSAGATPVWDATLLTGTYNNAVFGLAQDNGSGLLVNTANSINRAGLPGNVIISHPADLGDGEFLLIGDNGLTADQGAGEVPAGAGFRSTRKWLVQHTGNVGAVQLTFNLNGVTFSGTMLRDFRLMIDQDGDGNFATGPGPIVYKYPVSMVGNVLTFNNVVLGNGNTFALLTQASPALPVTWKSFTGQLKDDNVHLNWAVESNESGDRYEVEHSTDGIHYNVIGTVKNDAAVKTYNYISGTYANGANYYRIHQIDIDGKDIYSQVVTINIKAATDFAVKVLNNPVQTSTLKLEVRSANAVKASVELYSLSGVRVLNRQQMISGGKSQVFIPISSIPAGSYVLKVKTNDVVRTAGIIKL